MFQNKKSWRRVLLPVCCLAVLFLGMGGWKFQSVNSYKEEQEKQRQETETTDVENKAEEQGNTQERENSPTSQPAGKTKLANGGELVTPTVPQGMEGNRNTGEQEASEPGSEAGAAPDASGTDSEKGGGNEKTAEISGREQGTAGGTGEKTAQPSPAGESGGGNSSAAPGSQDGGGKTETAYNPQRTPSPAKEPKEGMVTGTVTIDCTRLLENMDALDGNLQSFVPSSGYIVRGQSFRLKEGANAYMALQAVCRELDIQLDASYTPFYNSFYIKGIGYLYEKSAGRKSGWLYSVNGEIPKVGVSAYTLQEGDEITFIYTCNGGNDVR